MNKHFTHHHWTVQWWKKYYIGIIAQSNNGYFVFLQTMCRMELTCKYMWTEKYKMISALCFVFGNINKFSLFMGFIHIRHGYGQLPPGSTQ